MGFIDNFAKLGGLGGVGAASSLISGIGGMIQNRKNAKFARRMAQKNFDLQKEYAEKNYQFQLDQAQVQQDQFQQQMEFNSPAGQRRMLEEAGYNPFMADMSPSMGAPSSSVSMPSQVSAPQYDISSVAQMEQLRQSNLSSTVGALSTLMDGLSKISTVDNNARITGANAAVAEGTIQSTIDLMQARASEAAASAAILSVRGKYLDSELKNAIELQLQQMDLNSISVAIGRYNVDSAYWSVKERKAAVDLIKEQLRGFRISNDIKEQLGYSYMESQIAQNYATAGYMDSSAALADANAFWARMPQTYPQYLYKTGSHGNRHYGGALYDMFNATLDDLRSRASGQYSGSRESRSRTRLNKKAENYYFWNQVGLPLLQMYSGMQQKGASLMPFFIK